MPRTSAVALALVLTGCGLALDLDPPDPRGKDGGAAPDAGGPVDGGAPADAPPGPDGGAPDAGPRPVLSCGGPSALQDAFAGTAVPEWADAVGIGPGATVVRDGSVFGVDVGLDLSSGAYYRSRETFDARDDVLAVQVTRTHPEGPVETFFSLVFGGRDHLSLVLAGNELRAIVETEATLVAEGVPWDPTAHRWWRIGGRAGLPVAETSPDGRTWSALPIPAVRADFLEGVQVELGARRRADGGEAALTTFDDLGLEPAPTPDPRCFIDAFRDDLAAGPNPYRWITVIEAEPVECSETRTPGSTVIRTVSGGCGLATRHLYVATGRSVSFHWGVRPSDATSEWGVAFQTRGGAVLTASCLGGAAMMVTPLDRVDFVCPSEPHWRFRHLPDDPAGPRVMWDVSDDGAAWRPATGALVLAPEELPGVTVTLGVNAPDGTSASVELLGYNTR